MSIFVIDACVAVKWYLREEDLVSEALEVRRQWVDGEIRLLAPDFFWIEIGSIFWKNVRKERVSLQYAKESLEDLVQSGLTTLTSVSVLADSFELANKQRRSVYDSVYLATAMATGTVLLTADEKLANSLPREFPIKWLGLL